MASRFNLRLAVLAAVLALSGCTAFPGGAHLEAPANGQPPPPAFRGLINSLDGDSTPKVRYIFHIHGMGLTDREDFHRQLYNLLITKGGYLPSETPSIDWTPAMIPEVIDVKVEGVDCGKPWKDHLDDAQGSLGGWIEKPCHFESFGKFRVDYLKNNSGEEVRLFTYFWHRDLWRLQEPLMRQDMLRHTSGTPALLNSLLKHETMDGGLSDAAAYIGPAGDLVRAGIGSALCTMSRDSVGKPFDPKAPRSLSNCGDDDDSSRSVKSFVPAEGVEFSFVTHSLGSRMLFDVIAPRFKPTVFAETRDPTTARGSLVERARVIFMAANQLPLLALGKGVTLKATPAPMKAAAAPAADAIAPSSSPPPPPLQSKCDALPVSFLVARCEAEEAAKEKRGGADAPVTAGVQDGPLAVIDFSDPDDVLGFRASDTLPDENMIDVIHRNAHQWLWVFVYPPKAHDHELITPDSAQMILCGATITSARKVKARDCGTY